MTDKASLARAIRQGRGTEPADLVIRNVGLLDIVSGGVTVTDIAICGDRIVGTYQAYAGTREIDARGLFAVPGFIDTHLHVESCMVAPLEYDRCVLPHGVTTAVCDPHEIANVLGLQGIRFFLESAEQTIMDLRVQLSSCVPATAFETAGATLAAADLVPLRSHPKVIGLAEFMNFPGVLNTDPAVLDKLVAFQDGHIDGHAPLVRGYDLNGYLAARIRNDHETTIAADGREKLKKGMQVLIREGSITKDLHALAEILDENTSSFCCLCTDDRNPLDLAEEGHLDYMIRTLIALGRPLHHVYRAASWSAANAFGLRDRGMIGVVPGKVITERAVKRVPSAGGYRAADPANDIAKVAVVERHGKNGNIGRGFVTGFGLKRGAIASSVGHDSHNICVVGVNDADMATAVNRIRAMHGGFVVVAGGQVIAELALTLAGLMSVEPFETVRAGLTALRRAAREVGCTLPEPFLQVAFLPLPVIPHLKITDFGLFDVDRFALVKE